MGKTTQTQKECDLTSVEITAYITLARFIKEKKDFKICIGCRRVWHKTMKVCRHCWGKSFYWHFISQYYLKKRIEKTIRENQIILNKERSDILLNEIILSYPKIIQSEKFDCYCYEDPEDYKYQSLNQVILK
jgi:hypothetical protein